MDDGWLVSAYSMTERSAKARTDTPLAMALRGTARAWSSLRTAHARRQA
jgi:hypothetical protein